MRLRRVLVILFMRNSSGYFERKSLTRLWSRNARRITRRSKGRPSIPPGVYFRMLLIGYFERIDSERGICWRCSDSLSLRQFLGLGMEERTPDHSSLSRIRNRLPLEVHESVFGWVLEVLASRGMIDGRWQDTGCGRDDAGSECGASVNRSSRHGGKLRIVFEGACAQEWYRRAERSGHCEVGQEAAKERVEQGVGESERARMRRS